MKRSLHLNTPILQWHLSHCEQEDSHLYRWVMNCGKHNIFYDFFTVCSCISVKFVIYYSYLNEKGGISHVFNCKTAVKTSF